MPRILSLGGFLLSGILPYKLKASWTLSGPRCTFSSGSTLVPLTVWIAGDLQAVSDSSGRVHLAVCILFYLLFMYLAAPGLSYGTRGILLWPGIKPGAPCIGSTESQPLGQ